MHLTGSTADCVGVELDLDLCERLDCLSEPVPPILLVDEAMIIFWRNDASRQPEFLNAVGAAGSDAGRCILEDNDANRRVRALVGRIFEQGGSEGLLLMRRPDVGAIRVIGSRRSFVRLSSEGQHTRSERVILVWRLGGGSDARRGTVGLSAVEARLVRHLAEGKTVRQASSQMNISYHTGRKYLQVIFSKTGARRQAELMAMVAGDRGFHATYLHDPLI